MSIVRVKCKFGKFPRQSVDHCQLDRLATKGGWCRSIATAHSLMWNGAGAAAASATSISYSKHSKGDWIRDSTISIWWIIYIFKLIGQRRLKPQSLHKHNFNPIHSPQLLMKDGYWVLGDICGRHHSCRRITWTLSHWSLDQFNSCQFGKIKICWLDLSLSNVAMVIKKETPSY